MKNLIKLSIKQAVLNNVLYVIMVIVGVYCLVKTPVERYPNIHMGDVFITTYLYGAAPADVERLVTAKLEKEIKQVKEVEFIKSTSYRNRSTIKVHFKDGSNYSEATANIKVRLESIQKDLPSYVLAPQYQEAKINEWAPVIRLNLFGNHDQNALNLISKDLKVKLESIEGVEKVQLIGENIQEYHVKLSPQLMRKFGVPFQAVVRAIQTANVNIPMGSLKVSDQEIFLTADEKIKSNEDILKVIIRRDGDGNFVRLGDIVTECSMSYQKPSIILSADGNECLGVQIHKAESGNAITIKKEAIRITEEFKKDYKDKADFKTVVTEDSTKTINESVETLSSSLMWGIGFVYLIMHFFMGFKNAFLAIIGIPFSFLVTMIFFRLTGNSINEISLFAFILVSGMIVSDAIVILENIHRHREEGSNVYDAVVNGTAEVIVPVVASSITTIAAFMPLLLMTGSTGAFFAIFPQAISFALIASLIEALLMLPLHYYDLTPKKKVIKKEVFKPNKVIVFLDFIYSSSLKFCLNYKFISLGLLLLLCIFGFTILFLSVSGKSKLINVKFFPDTYLQYFVVIEAPISTPLNQTNDYLTIASNEIKKGGQGEYDVVGGIAGMYMNEDYLEFYGYQLGMLTVSLPENSLRKFADFPKNDPKKHLDSVLARIQPLMPPDVKVSIRPSYDGPPSGKPVSIRIFGQNDKNVSLLSDKLFDYLQKDPAFKKLKNLKTNLGETRKVATMKTKALKAKDYGLSSLDILGIGAGLIDGQVVGKFRGPREDIDLKVMVDEKELSKPEDILNIPIIEDAKSPVLISDVARFEYMPEISTLNRYNEQRSIEITADINEDLDNAPSLAVLIKSTFNTLIGIEKDNQEEVGLSPQIVNAKVNAFYKEIAKDYSGAQVNFEGEFKATQESYDSLKMAFLVAMMLIYVILAWLFQSYFQPFIILSTIFFAAIGVIMGLLFTREYFTINVFMGVVGLAGVAVNDSIVLLDFINQARKNGKELRSSIVDGCGLRMRAIMLTTVTTILGLLPTALGFPSYSPTWSGMAISFVSGLIVSTFLTMLMIPVIYEVVESIKIKVYGRDIYLVKKTVTVKRMIKKVIKKSGIVSEEPKES
jgi:HAE1 family hydrophobic/amphiphilic exporter-1